ncbi:benzoate 4-monooxygenase cytochrome P450 [Apiospora aurea]|uniref:Benzoate 4-monooxygenase cytochrome P450 n=1 Tax=Apiospora aurea TaxID=335848 RepID=A0ABR1PX58_9PEZI
MTFAWTVSPALGAAGVLCGFTTHHGVFIRGEWHVHAPWIVLSHLWIFTCLILADRFVMGSSPLLLAAPYGVVLISCSYLTGLFLSIVVYRAFHHRLTKAGFPGPWYARVTKLWHVWACRDSKNHVVLHKLHEQYGDFVRTGPSELTVYRPEILMAIDGPHSECIKTDWYDLLLPNFALVTAREKGGVHAARRRQWNRAFSSQALQDYLQRILCHLEDLYVNIAADAESGRVSNARDLFYWYSFDAMGDFALGKPFGMQKSQEWHIIIVRLQRAFALADPYWVPLGPRVLQLKDWFDMVFWCQTQMKSRIEDKSRHEGRDITHYIMMQDEESEEVINDALRWLSGDSLQTIVAGSGPIANALVGLFTEVGRNPKVLEHLYQEVKDVDVADAKALASLTFLNACIEETLRLYPALMTGGSRMTTHGGLAVCGRWIPPYTNIVAPQYLISRRDDCFVQPYKFVPERWTTAPEMVLNALAARPFGTGHTSCVGRPLAMDALRLAVAGITKKYKFRLAPGEDGRGMDRDLKDQFVPNPGGLRLCFEMRHS